MKPAQRPPESLGSLELGLPGAERSGLFLGRFDEEGLRRELEEAGLLAALAERGYPEIVLRTEVQAGEHRLDLRARRGRVRLVDLRLVEASARVDEPLAREHGLDLLSLLMIRWLALQHPKARFSRVRPRLPGQRFPGLRLARPVVLRLLRWARSWGMDGLANIPQYYHNALFYSAIFRFLSPSRQGRFEALIRDLEPLPVARASAAVDAGRVIAMPADEPFAWTAGEMLTPLTACLQAYFDSRDYREAVAASREGVRFRVESRGSRA